MDSGKPILGGDLARANAVLMIFNLLKKLFDKYAGTGQDVKKNKSIKETYSNNKNNGLRAEAVKKRINQLLNERKLSSLRDRLLKIRGDSGLSNPLSVDRYIQDTDPDTILTNTTELVREIMTPEFVSNYNNILSPQKEQEYDDDEEEEDDDGETIEDIRKRQAENDQRVRQAEGMEQAKKKTTAQIRGLANSRRDEIRMEEAKKKTTAQIRGLANSRRDEIRMEEYEELKKREEELNKREEELNKRGEEELKKIQEKEKEKEEQENILKRQVDQETINKLWGPTIDQETIVDGNKKKKKKKKKSRQQEIETGTPDVKMQFVEPPTQPQSQPEEKLSYGGLTLTERGWENLVELKRQMRVGEKYQRRAARSALNTMIERWRNDPNQRVETFNDVDGALLDYSEDRRAPPTQRFISTRRGGTVTGKTVSAAGYQKQSEDRIMEGQKLSENRIRGNLTNVLTEVVGTRQNITNAEIRRQEAETKATEQRNLLLQRQEEIKSSLDNLNVQYPELKNQAQKVSNQLKRLRLTDTKQLLNNNQINDIVGAMPPQYRGTLGRSIGSVLSGSANLNTIASGLLGMSTVILSGNPMIGGLVQQASQYIMDAYGVDLNNILEQPEPIPSLQDPNLGEVTTAPSAQNPARQTNELMELKGERDEKDEEKVFDRDLERIILSNQERHVRAILEQVPQEVKESMDSLLLTNFAVSYVLSKYLAIQSMRDIQNIPIQDIYDQQEFLDFISATTGVQQTQQNNINTEIEDGKGFLQYLRDIVPGLGDLIPPIPLDSLIERLPTLSQINKYLPTFLRLPETKSRPQLMPPETKSRAQLMPPARHGRLVPRLDSPRDATRQNTMLGMVGAGAAAYARGGAIEAVGALPLGALGGGLLTPIMVNPMIRRFYEQTGRDMNSPQGRREIQFLKTLSPAVIGALLGYSGVGKEYTSGAGITERKITVDPSVLAETKAVDQQEGKDPKKWITKAIMPTPDILDETRQEKFIDDLEYAAFNYIEPGSEGANGNLKTNPLKRSQFLSEQLRYMDAGISTPSMLYNVQFPTNTPQKQMETYKLGQDMLPQMEFLVDDNADTFTPIGKHYVNNNDVAVELLSPFANFSDVRNYWAINRKSNLYNLYA